MTTDLRLSRVEGKEISDLSILLRNIMGFSDSINMDRVNELVNEQGRPILELDKQGGISGFILPSDMVLDLYRTAVWDYLLADRKHEIYTQFFNPSEVVSAFLNVKRYLKNKNK